MGSPLSDIEVANDGFVRKRLLNKFKSLKENESRQEFCVSPYETDIMKWDGIIFGPPSSSYENGIFRLMLQFSNRYPFEPPQVKFLSRMFHPNVSKDGEISMDVLQSNWTPAFTVKSIIENIILMLDHPNFEDMAISNIEARDLLLQNIREYKKMANACVEQSLHDDSNVSQGKLFSFVSVAL